MGVLILRHKIRRSKPNQNGLRLTLEHVVLRGALRHDFAEAEAAVLTVALVHNVERANATHVDAGMVLGCRHHQVQASARMDPPSDPLNIAMTATHWSAPVTIPTLATPWLVLLDLAAGNDHWPSAATLPAGWQDSPSASSVALAGRTLTYVCMHERVL